MLDESIEQRFPRYYEFGHDETGLRNIATIHSASITSLTQVEADILIAQRNEAIDMIYELANALEKEAPEVFELIWSKNSS